MKVVHWVAIVALALLTLMNLGSVTSGWAAGAIVLGVALGVAGLVALYGMIRRTSWSPVVALIVGAANVVGAVIGMIAGWDGWPVGLTVSVITLILIAISESGALRRGSVVAAR
jgi:hypothetical protein